MHASRCTAVALVTCLVVGIAACSNGAESRTTAGDRQDPPSQGPPQSSAGRDGGGGSVSQGSSMCAATLHFDGRRYLGYGSGTVIPPETPVLGEGTLPSCPDHTVKRAVGTVAPSAADGDVYSGETVAVRSLAGVPPSEAVVVGQGDVFVAEDVEELSEGIRAYFDRVRCSTDGQFSVVGQWSAVSPGVGGDLPPPYEVTVLVHGGDNGGEKYRRSYVRIAVTESTTPELDHEDVKAALPGTLTGQLHCEGSRFVAYSLTVGDDPR